MLRERIDDARPELDALGCLRRRRENHPHAAQKQIVADPERVEPDLLRLPRQARVVLNGQVVVEANAKSQAAEPMTASASISTSRPSINPATCTSVLAGLIAPNTSPCARATSRQSSSRATNTRVRTTSPSSAPASRNAVSIFA